MADPVADKDLNHTYCLLVPCGDCYSVLCEHVSHDKNILLAVAGNIERGEVNGQYLEWLAGQQVSHGWVGGWLFSQGAALTGLDILADVFSHPWPVCLGADQPQGVLRTLMSHAIMEFLKNVWTKTGWEDQLLEVAKSVVMGLLVQQTILHLQTLVLPAECQQCTSCRIFGWVWPCLQDRSNPKSSCCSLAKSLDDSEGSTLVEASSFAVGAVGDELGKTACGASRRSHQTSWTLETSAGTEVGCVDNSLPAGILDGVSAQLAQPGLYQTVKSSCAS